MHEYSRKPKKQADIDMRMKAYISVLHICVMTYVQLFARAANTWKLTGLAKTVYDTTDVS